MTCFLLGCWPNGRLALIYRLFGRMIVWPNKTIGGRVAWPNNTIRRMVFWPNRTIRRMADWPSGHLATIQIFHQPIVSFSQTYTFAKRANGPVGRKSEEFFFDKQYIKKN
jgi:hypothetical protein